MHLHISGAAIRQIRGELGMTQPQFAQLFGVHPMTVYRWEAELVSLSILHVEILVGLQAWLAEQNRRRQQELRDSIIKGLAIGGTIAGLALLLSELAAPEKPKRRKRTQRKKKTARRRS